MGKRKGEINDHSLRKSGCFTFKAYCEDWSRIGKDVGPFITAGNQKANQRAHIPPLSDQYLRNIRNAASCQNPIEHKLD